MKPTEQINEWIAHGMNLPVDDMHDEDVALLDEFSKRLKGLMLQPTLPPNQYLEKVSGALLSVLHEIVMIFRDLHLMVYIALRLGQQS